VFWDLGKQVTFFIIFTFFDVIFTFRHRLDPLPYGHWGDPLR